MELRSHADPEAKAATLAEYRDIVEGYLLDKIVDFYALEVRLQRLRENPRVMALVRMKVGQSIPWDYGVLERRGRRYLQTADRERAREVLKTPSARWSLKKDPRNNYWRVVRLA